MTRRKSNGAGAGAAGPRKRATGLDGEALAAVSGTITALKVQERDQERVSVYVDGEFVLGLHAELVVRAGLKKGRQVDGAYLIGLARQEQERAAWNAALVYLGAAERTRRQVEQRLRRRYEEPVVSRVLERLAAGGWLDDAEYARRYVSSNPDFGVQRLLYDLHRRGVAREAAMEAVRAAPRGGEAVAVARELAERRLSRMDGVDRVQAQRRLSSLLARRGFDFETVKKALGPLLQELPMPRRGGGLGRGRSAPEEDD